MTDVLLFGGTVEGRELAVALADAGIEVTVSVATEAGEKVLPQNRGHLHVHQGRLDETAMSRLVLSGFDCVVDATHPYAVEVSRNVRHAADEAQLPCLRVVRPAGDTTGCLVVGSVAEAIDAVRRPGNVLSTTGSKEIRRYTSLPDFARRLYARVLDDDASVEACHAIGLSDDHILDERGPFTLEHNLEQIDAYAITTLITKDGGTAGGYPAKLEAARARDVDIIVIARPGLEEGMTMQEALDAILGRDARARDVREGF